MHSKMLVELNGVELEVRNPLCREVPSKKSCLQEMPTILTHMQFSTHVRTCMFWQLASTELPLLASISAVAWCRCFLLFFVCLAVFSRRVIRCAKTVLTQEQCHENRRGLLSPRSYKRGLLVTFSPSCDGISTSKKLGAHCIGADPKN